MAQDPRRFDDLVATVRSMRSQLDTLQNTILNRVATHTHTAVSPVAVACSAGGNTNVSVGSGAWTSLTVFAATATTGWTVSGTTITPPVAGYYLLGGGGYLQGSGGTLIAARWQVTGTPVNYSQANGAGSATSISPNPVVVYLATTDTVELQVYQNSGSARTSLASQTAVTVTLLGSS